MTLSEFESFIRLIVPSANKKRVTQTNLRSLINKGVRNVNSQNKVLTQGKFFDAEANVGEYKISDVSAISDFVLVGTSGIWFNKGTVASPYYVEMWGVDEPYLNARYRRWRTAASGNPQFAIFLPNRIIIYPKPGAALSNGFHLPDYVYKTTDMSSAGHYPFTGSTTEYPGLEVLDDAIIDYVRWILGFSVGETQEGIITRLQYNQTVKDTDSLLRRRPDFNANRRDFRMKIGRIAK